MTSRVFVIAGAAALAAVVALGGVRLAAARKAAQAPEEKAPDSVLVRTARVTRMDLAERVALTGSIRARNEVDVFPKLPGRLEVVHVQVGDRVRRGQVLAEVEHKELDWQVRASEAAVETARAAVQLAEAGLAGAQLEHDRTEALVKAGSAPAAALDGARIKLQASKAQLAQARAATGQAESALGLVRQNVANARIESPIDGVVVRRAANPGVMAGPQLALFAVQDTAALKLESSVEAAVAARLTRGAPVDVTVDGRGGETFRGKVDVLSPSLDPATRRAALEVLVENRGGRLMTNMFARARITVGKLLQVLAVPREAVLEQADGAVVFRVKDGRAQAVRPKLGPDDGSFVAALEGLAEGDEVVVGGLGGIADGMPVRTAVAAIGTR